jgi:hypothetical protein
MDDVIRPNTFVAKARLWLASTAVDGAYSAAREIWLDAKFNPNVPAFSAVLACSTIMAAAIGSLRSSRA